MSAFVSSSNGWPRSSRVDAVDDRRFQAGEKSYSLSYGGRSEGERVLPAGSGQPVHHQAAGVGQTEHARRFVKRLPPRRPASGRCALKSV